MLAELSMELYQFGSFVHMHVIKLLFCVVGDDNADTARGTPENLIQESSRHSRDGRKMVSFQKIYLMLPNVKNWRFITVFIHLRRTLWLSPLWGNFLYPRPTKLVVRVFWIHLVRPSVRLYTTWFPERNSSFLFYFLLKHI